MKNVTIQRVWAQDDRIMVAMDIVDPDDPSTVDHRGYSFPKDTLEWRVAEYGLDPGDLRGGAELIIMEAFAPPAMAGDAKGLFRSATIADAREVMLDRIARTRSGIKLDVSRKGGAKILRGTDTGGDFLDDIGALCEMDPEVIGLKRTLVEKQRERFSPGATMPRSESIRRQIDAMDKPRRR